MVESARRISRSSDSSAIGTAEAEEEEEEGLEEEEVEDEEISLAGRIVSFTVPHIAHVAALSTLWYVQAEQGQSRVTSSSIGVGIK